MKRLSVLPALLLALAAGTASAQLPEYQGAYTPGQSLQEYFAESEQNENKSIIYVFFNNAPCETCPQTIDLIEKIYYSYYSQEYSLFLINYAEDQDYDFIETYNLRNPLEVVLVRISDGSAFGYRKLQNLQDQISDPVSFTENFTNEVNDFLGDGSSSL